MIKRFAIISAAPMAALILGASQVAAQESLPPSDDVQIAYVYGEDAAPDCPEGNICVFARLPEDERYRIPPNLRISDNPANTAWARRVESFEAVGDFGTLSCSPTGAGGITGCTQKFIDAAFADRAESAEVRFSQLIEEARAERLSTIDADAAAEQSRVEEIEREYLERLERERDGALPGETSDNQGPPAETDGQRSAEDAPPLAQPPQ
ncbi:MAG: hypothetical protein ABJP48_05270 [Erythrobacter sp.]